MKIIIGIIFTLFLASCAHHHKTPEHHHHAYEKHCAYSIAHGDLETMGNNEFKLAHGGKTYYFSSKEKLNEFKENIEKNIKNANKSWLGRAER